MQVEQYRIQLEEPFTCGDSPVVSNEIQTADHVPATVLRGAIYTALARAGRGGEVEGWLGTGPGRPRYSPGWPVMKGAVTVPMPLSFLADKGDGGLGGEFGCVNALWFADGELPKEKDGHRLQWTRPGQKWLERGANGEPAQGWNVETESRMHVGLHYGRQASRQGALYSRSEIPAGTEFRFLLRGRGETGELPREVYLGKRRSAGNGAARVDRLGEYTVARGMAPDKEILVQFLSDCLLPSAEGNWELGLNESGWRRVLGVMVEGVTGKSAHRQVHGWSGVWGRPREAVTAIAAGSVFRLRMGTAEDCAAALKMLENAEGAGFGSRVEEGFGWIAVNPAWLFAGENGAAFGQGSVKKDDVVEAAGTAALPWPGLEGVSDARRLVGLARRAKSELHGRKLAELSSLAARTEGADAVWQFVDRMAGREHARGWDTLKGALGEVRKACLRQAELRFVIDSAAALSRRLSDVEAERK